MIWSIPEIPEVTKPASKSNTTLWLAGLLTLYLIASPFIWKLWSNENRSLLWLAIISPMLMWVTSLFTVFIWKMNQDSQFKAWEREKDNIRQRWILWAQQKLALVGSGFHLPATIDTAEIFLQNGIGKKGHVYTFSTDLDSDNHISVVYTKCFEEITDLLHRVRTDKVNIYIEAEDEEGYLKHIEHLETFLNEMNLEYSYKPQVIQTDMKLNLLNYWFENTIDGLNIIFSVSCNHDDQSPEFTEHISWVALASTEWAKHNKLPIHAFIQRPIDIDILDKHLLETALKQFNDYGLSGKEVETFWPACTSQENGIQLNAAFFKAGISLPFENNQAAIRNIDSYIGAPPTNIASLVLALAVQNCGHQQQQLFAWTNENGLVNLSLLYTDESDLSS